MNKGFTLVELLVVVLIIGILSVVALPQYTDAVERARAAEVMVNAKAIMDGIQRHQQMYPSGYVREFKELADVDIKGKVSTGASVIYTKNFKYELKATPHNTLVISRNKEGSLVSDAQLYDITYTYTEEGADILCCPKGHYGSGKKALGVERICNSFNNMSVVTHTTEDCSSN